MTKEVFEKLGVEPILAVGEKFDANFHNAVMHIDDENYGENEVCEEFVKGPEQAPMDCIITFSPKAPLRFAALDTPTAMMAIGMAASNTWPTFNPK